MSFIVELKGKIGGKFARFRNNVMITACAMARNEDAVSASELPILFIGLAIAITVMSAVIPGSFTTLFNVTTDSWPTAVAALFDVIPIVIIAGIVMVFYGWYKNK